MSLMCPKCGGERMMIDVTTRILVGDRSVEVLPGRWSATDPAGCTECTYIGTVLDFEARPPWSIVGETKPRNQQGDSEVTGRFLTNLAQRLGVALRDEGTIELDKQVYRYRRGEDGFNVF